MSADCHAFEETCRTLHASFFGQYHNDELQKIAGRALCMLLKRQSDLPGDAGSWAGGIVYAVSTIGCGVPGVMNADLEKAFNTKMAAIRKRAAQVRRLLGDDLPIWIQGIAAPEEFTPAEFTLRDEANAICAYAFRNGPLERIHHEYKISDLDMKEFNINASEHLAKIMAMRRDTPEEYDRFIRHFHRQFCGRWER
jgi:hypothetical protein